MRSHSKLVWHRAFLPRSELLFQEVLKAVLEVAIVSFWTLIISEIAAIPVGSLGLGLKGHCVLSPSRPPIRAASLLLHFCLKSSRKYDTSISVGAELHKETRDKFLVLSKLEIFPLTNFPHMRSVN